MAHQVLKLRKINTFGNISEYTHRVKQLLGSKVSEKDDILKIYLIPFSCLSVKIMLHETTRKICWLSASILRDHQPRAAQI